jgi:hypothetical protein
MRRAALLGILLALASTAPAAAWVELPPYAIPHDGVADCLRAAGPGQLALLGHLGRTTSATDLVTFGPRGLARTSSTTLGRLTECPEVAVAPGTTPLLVAPTLRSQHDASSALHAADAGGPPATISPPGVVADPSVAIAPNGAAVVAWIDADPLTLDETAYAAIRPAAGKPFDPPVRLGAAATFGASPVAAIDAAGRATVAWDGIGGRQGTRELTVATSALPGERFTAPQRLAPDDGEEGDEIALAVSPAGRTLVVAASGSLTAFERLAGATRFAPVALPPSHSPIELAVALADDGGAVIAYSSAPVPAFALLRRPGAAFGADQALQPATSPADDASGPLLGEAASPLYDANAGHIAALLTPDSRVLVTWTVPGDPRRASAARASRGTLSGGMSPATSLGSPCRATNGAQPSMLADGSLVAAWTDNARVRSLGDDVARGGGLLHAALTGATPPHSATRPLRLSARLVGPRALRPGQELRVRVRCDRGPCFVRVSATAYASVRGQLGADPAVAAASTQLLARRPAVLALKSGDLDLAPAGRATTPISLIACEPSGRIAARLTLRARLRRLPPRPLPHVRDLVARRRGDRIHVTWRTSIAARDATFWVSMGPFDLRLGVMPVAGRGRTRFSVTLDVPRGSHPREVDVGTTVPGQEDTPSARTRIR